MRAKMSRFVTTAAVLLLLTLLPGAEEVVAQSVDDPAPSTTKTQSPAQAASFAVFVNDCNRFLGSWTSALGVGGGVADSTGLPRDAGTVRFLRPAGHHAGRTTRWLQQRQAQATESVVVTRIEANGRVGASWEVRDGQPALWAIAPGTSGGAGLVEVLDLRRTSVVPSGVTPCPLPARKQQVPIEGMAVVANDCRNPLGSWSGVGLTVRWGSALPVVARYEDVTLSRAAGSGAQHTTSWLQLPASQPGTTQRIDILLANSKGALLLGLSLRQAVPLRWGVEGPGVAAQVATERLELRHTGFLESPGDPCPAVPVPAATDAARLMLVADDCRMALGAWPDVQGLTVTLPTEVGTAPRYENVRVSRPAGSDTTRTRAVIAESVVAGQPIGRIDVVLVAKGQVLLDVELRSARPLTWGIDVSSQAGTSVITERLELQHGGFLQPGSTPCPFLAAPTQKVATRVVAVGNDCQTPLAAWSGVSGLQVTLPSEIGGVPRYADLALSRAASTDARRTKSWLELPATQVGRPQRVDVLLTDNNGATVTGFVLREGIPLQWAIDGATGGSAAPATERLTLRHTGFLELGPITPCPGPALGNPIATARLMLVGSDCQVALGSWSGVAGLSVAFPTEVGLAPRYEHVRLSRPAGSDLQRSLSWLRRPETLPGGVQRADVVLVSAGGGTVLDLALSSVVPVQWSLSAPGSAAGSAATEQLVLRHSGFLAPAGFSESACPRLAASTATPATRLEVTAGDCQFPLGAWTTVSGLRVRWPDVLPGVLAYEDVTLSRAVTSPTQTQATEAWLRSQQASLTPSTMHVVLRAPDGSPVTTMLLSRSVPLSWNVDGLGTPNVPVETLQVRHSGFIEPLDAGPATPCP